MAWRVDPFGGKIDWMIEVATKYQETGSLPSRDDSKINKKLSGYVRGILQSWTEKGVFFSSTKPVDNQVCDLALYTGALMERSRPQTGASTAEIEAFDDDYLDLVELFYEEKIQPLKKKVQGNSELFRALETIESRVKMYAKQFGLILENSDGVDIDESREDQQISDKMVDEIFDLELNLTSPSDLEEKNFLYQKGKEVVIDPRSLSVDSAFEELTDIESADVSAMPSPIRLRKPSDSSDSIKESTNEEDEKLSMGLCSLCDTLQVEPETAKVLEKKGRTSRIEIPKVTESLLAQELKNPIRRVYPIITPVAESKSQRFLKELERSNLQVARSAEAVLELSIMNPLKLAKGSIPRKAEEEYVPANWSEEDNSFKIEL